jgi:FkbM family methyltransferase
MSPAQHRHLRWIARGLLTLPGARRTVRRLLRLAIQHGPLSRPNRQRLYGFFAPEVAPAGNVDCTVRVAPGANVRLSLRLDDWVNSQLYYWGYDGYEPGVTLLMRSLLRSRRSVLDIGANIGYYTVLAATLAPEAEVHAFEPWPLLFERLHRNVALNGFRRVHLSRVAVSDRDGSAVLHLPSPSPGDLHLTNASLLPGFTAQGSIMEVPVTRLDTYCHGRVTRQVDLIKIDVEGAELSVLRGMGDLLDRWRPDIILEVLEGYAEELEAFFAPRPYRRFLITKAGLQEVQRLSAHPTLRDYYMSVAPASGWRS